MRWPGGSCLCRSRQSRTSHVFCFETVHYRHHPLFGRQVRVVARRKGVGSEDVVVELPDGTNCALPGWMLDATVCAALTDSAVAVISRAALRALCRLVDSQCPLVHGWCGEPGGSPAGGSHGPTDREAAQAPLRGARALGASWGSEAGAVPEVAQPAPSGSRDGGVHREEEEG